MFAHNYSIAFQPFLVLSSHGGQAVLANYCLGLSARHSTIRLALFFRPLLSGRELGPFLLGWSGPRQAAAWIHRTSVHLSLDRLRKRRRRSGTADLGEPIATGVDPGEILQNRRSIEILVEHLPSDVLEAAILYRVDGLEQVEIARLMDCSERTVRRLLEKLEVRLAHLRSEMLT